MSTALKTKRLVEERVMVIDTVGSQMHPIFEDTFGSFCDFYYMQPKKVRGKGWHPHGGWCAWEILSQLSGDVPVDILMLQIFDENGMAIDNIDDYMFGAIRDFSPHRINCSWGMSDGDDVLTDMAARMFYDSEHIKKVEKAIEQCGCEFYFAAGNSGDLRSDPDVDYPQRLLHGPYVHVIGACNADGVPCTFSGDGEQVDAMYLGQDAASIDPITGKWIWWSGTSRSTPGALGDSIVNNVFGPEVVSRYINLSTIMEGWERGKHSKKAGYGCMEWSHQRNLKATGLYPADIDPRSIRTIAFDRKML